MEDPEGGEAAGAGAARAEEAEDVVRRGVLGEAQRLLLAVPARAEAEDAAGRQRDLQGGEREGSGGSPQRAPLAEAGSPKQEEEWASAPPRTVTLPSRPPLLLLSQAFTRVMCSSGARLTSLRSGDDAPGAASTGVEHTLCTDPSGRVIVPRTWRNVE